MDPRAQDILLCDLCQTAALQSHCELCHVNLCIGCVGKHLSDSSKRHKVVLYNYRTSTHNYPTCTIHTEKHCELYCEKCDIPICLICISSGKHKGHDISDIRQKRNYKAKDLQEELQELENRIDPFYKEIKSELNSEKISAEIHYEKLTTAVAKQGEDWHKEINTIVKKQKSEIDEMKSKHLDALNKQEKEIEKIISDVNQSILDLKKILDSSDVSLKPAYKSRNAQFKCFPPKVKVSLPSFSPFHINTDQLHAMFGSLSALSITMEEGGYTMITTEAVSCPPAKTLLVEPEITTIIRTFSLFLYSVTCQSDEEIWTRGEDKIMKLYNLQSRLLKSIQTKSGKEPCDMAVTTTGDLVYTDPNTRTVNIVKNKRIQEVIKLQGWKPYYVCSTSSNDILVTMVSDDYRQSKVVRYSGSTVKQTIQFDSESKPLYSFNHIKYISENRNLDICVADHGSGELVVVNQAGKLRFKYIGHPCIFNSFNPVGITTDSQSQILTVDLRNKCIHILDQDGQFLRYIDNCNLQNPWGLCVDTRDNLFVAERSEKKVMKIKYM
ncbi:uncharacterized protein LOC134232744 [Saccostrea cucullata]|uniref:uncharacterized protein LOC134232744 n=1 Tax=Saccostrea cuccullata TaxID=36930 RepID=UPI002ED34B4F